MKKLLALLLAALLCLATLVACDNSDEPSSSSSSEASSSSSEDLSSSSEEPSSSSQESSSLSEEPSSKEPSDDNASNDTQNPFGAYVGVWNYQNRESEEISDFDVKSIKGYYAIYSEYSCPTYKSFAENDYDFHGGYYTKLFSDYFEFSAGVINDRVYDGITEQTFEDNYVIVVEGRSGHVRSETICYSDLVQKNGYYLLTYNLISYLEQDFSEAEDDYTDIVIIPKSLFENDISNIKIKVVKKEYILQENADVSDAVLETWLPVDRIEEQKLDKSKSYQVLGVFEHKVYDYSYLKNKFGYYYQVANSYNEIDGMLEDVTDVDKSIFEDYFVFVVTSYHVSTDIFAYQGYQNFRLENQIAYFDCYESYNSVTSPATHIETTCYLIPRAELNGQELQVAEYEITVHRIVETEN